jgi:hypothetical protein
VQFTAQYFEVLSVSKSLTGFFFVILFKLSKSIYLYPSAASLLIIGSGFLIKKTFIALLV